MFANLNAIDTEIRFTKIIRDLDAIQQSIYDARQAYADDEHMNTLLDLKQLQLNFWRSAINCAAAESLVAHQSA